MTASAEELANGNTLVGAGVLRLASPRAVAGIVLVLAAAVQLAQVDDLLDLANGDFYLRNATAYAEGSVARSRYSPGLGLFLSPLARIAGADYRLLTFLAEATMAIVTVAALYVLYRLLRVYLPPWPAVVLLAAFGLGQSAAVFLSGAEAEALALLLVAGSLLALARDRPWWAVALGGLAVLVRVALAPFFGVVFLLLLLRRRRSGATGLLAVTAAGFAHIASGPLVDQSYVGIASAIYGEDGGDGGVLGRVADGVITRAGDYLRFGIPRLVVPFRLLDTPVGPVISLGVVVAVVAGIVLLRRDRVRWEAGAPGWTLDTAGVASVALIGFLLFWPVRAGEASRLVVPIVALPLLGLGRSAVGLLGRRPRRLVTSVGAAAVLALLLVNVVATGPAIAARRQRPSVERRFLAVHEQAHDRVWTGPVLSRKPAFTELTTGRVSYSYPIGGFAEGVEDLSRRTRACTLVIDELFEGTPPDVVAWIDARQDQVIAADGGTRIVTIRAPWCDG